MKRAYLIELSIFKGYGLQLLVLGFVIALFVGVGMQTTIVAPAILTSMFFIMAAMGTAIYDEQNNWGLYRLTLPLSRRDIVASRYLVIVTLGLAGTAAGVAAAAVVSGVASAVQLPDGMSELLVLDAGGVTAMLFASAFCVFMGSLIAGIVTPVYFKLGQTKATQLIPTVVVVIFIAPMLVIANSGLLDSSILNSGFFADVMAFLDSPAGVGAGIAVLLAVSAVILAASAAVSLKLYEKREL